MDKYTKMGEFKNNHSKYKKKPKPTFRIFFGYKQKKCYL
jgi:hypothetical protein